MVKEIAHLSSEDQALVVDAIPYITILIAGADGVIDEKETAWAEKITDIRSYATPDKLNDYYKVVGDRFDKRMTELLIDLPNEVEPRTNAISAELSKLNGIFKEIPHFYAQALYDSYTSFAEHMAKASGGFLGMMSVSDAEEALVGLPMIEPFN